MGIFNMILGISLIAFLLQTKSSLFRKFKCNFDLYLQKSRFEFQVNPFYETFPSSHIKLNFT